MNERDEGAGGRVGGEPAAGDDAGAGGGEKESFGALFKKFGAVGPLAVAALVLPPIGGFAILGTLGIVGPWLRSHDAVGVGLYVAAFTVCAGLAILPTYSQAILGGWAFGLAVGFPAALAGFLGASVIGYVIARRAASGSVERVLAEKPTWAAVRDALVGSGFWRTLGIVTLLRLPPNSPFALSNLVYGSTRVHPAPYMLGTLFGMAPRTFVAVWLADGLRALTIDEATDARPPLWVFVSGAVLAIGALAVVGSLANRAIKRMGVTARGEGGGSAGGGRMGA